MATDISLAARRAMRNSCKALTATCAFIALAALNACGGGGSDPGDGLECLFANCKDSPDVAVADISGVYEVVQEGARVTATSTLGYRSNLFGVVRLRGSDTLTMVIGAQGHSMRPTDSTLWNFIARFDGQAPAATVSVDFARGTQIERSTVTLPRPFVLLSPLGPVNLPLSAGQLLVDVSIPTDEPLRMAASGSCQRADGSTFNVSEVGNSQLVSAVGTGSRYRVDTPTLDSTVNLRGNRPELATQSKVTQCDLSVNWQREIVGSSPAGMHRTSRITGITRQPMTLHYDALQ